MSIRPNQFRRDHPWTRFVLLNSSAGPVPSQAKVTHSLTLSLKKIILSLTIIKSLTTRPAKQSNTSSVEVSVLLHVHSWIFFLRITLMSGLLLLVTGRALLMSPKGRNASRDGLV